MSKSKLPGLGKRDPQQFCDWMDGYCSAFNDLPDGAWQVSCEGGVDEFNKIHQTQIDSFDGWMFWIQNRKED